VELHDEITLGVGEFGIQEDGVNRRAVIGTAHLKGVGQCHGVRGVFNPNAVGQFKGLRAVAGVEVQSEDLHFWCVLLCADRPSEGALTGQRVDE